MTNDRPTKPLQSLSTFNAARRQAIIDTNKPRRNGIACPTCGAELWDSQPAIVLTSIPAQTYVRCESCGYTGTRVL